MKKPMLILLILLLISALTLGLLGRYEPEAAPASAGITESDSATATDLPGADEATMTSLPAAETDELPELE